MHAPPAQVEPGIWQAAGHPVVIEYSPAVLDEIRIAAVDGFTRLGHGGVEVGGVLLGRRDGLRIRILAHQPLPCEYALGPSFTLSPKDERALTNLLASLAGGPRDLQPVGWYHSHTRSEISLSEKDLQLFDKYFPGPWQIALVVRPQRFDPPRAGFFFRQPDNSIHADSSYQEFVLHPSAAPRRPTETQTPPPKAAERRTLAIRRELLQIPSPPPPDDPPQPNRDPLHASNEPPQATPAVTKRVTMKWIFRCSSVAAVALAAIAFYFYFSAHAAAPPELGLRAIDVGGQLRIDWNRNAAALRRAHAGALEIQDGEARLRESLDPADLRTGSLTYLRKSGNVVVRLLLTMPDRTTADEVTRFIGAPVALATLGSTGTADRVVEDDPQPAPHATRAPSARLQRKLLKLPSASKPATGWLDILPLPPAMTAPVAAPGISLPSPNLPEPARTTGP